MNGLVERIKKYEFIYRVIKKSYSIIQDNHALCVFFHKLVALLEKTRVDLYDKESLINYCISNQIKLEIEEAAKGRDVYVPKFYEHDNDPRVLRFESPQIYRVRLTNVSIVGGSSIVLKEKWALYDMFKLDKDNRFDLRFGPVISISDKGEVAVKSHRIKGESIEKGIFLVGFGSYNYYHLTIELMGKFKYIDNSVELVSCPLIIDEIVLAIPQFKAMLDSLNTSNRQIIPLRKGTKYWVNEIIYISDVSWMPINLKGGLGLVDKDCRVSKECIDYLRERVMNSYQISFSFNPELKLFLSRKSRFLQRLSNESEIALLFRRYGFKIIYPEELSLKEQIELFSSASIVVGTTGAALTNIIYCSPGTTFVSIIPKDYNFNVYSTIAYNMGLNPLYLDAKVIKQGKKISDDVFEIDISYCERFLINFPL